MRFIADLHIHSLKSRATSKEMRLENLARWAQLKGITLLGTGDFTHPEWFSSLTEKLEEAEYGLYKLKAEYENAGNEQVPRTCRQDVRFILSAEVSCIYSKKGKTRKVHHVILVPTFTAAGKINRALSKIGNLKADGRPILGLDSKILLQIVLEASDEALLIPAHAWTPHFSIFGANSGFDSIEECFEELSQHIYAIETGLSSDPPMNWRLSLLDRITLVSNSDAHSPRRIGREANIFDTELSYKNIYMVIKEKNKRQFIGTIEFFPEEGKYHYDGHRLCKQRMSPKDTIRHKGLCPVCGNKVTIGVMHRVELLADREEGFVPHNAIPYRSLIPLDEIISEVTGSGINSKIVERRYFNLLASLGNELSILLEIPIEEITMKDPEIARAIQVVREGHVDILPGYDGEYGTIKIPLPEETDKDLEAQLRLF